MTDHAIQYLPLAALVADEANPKAHDLGLIGSSVNRFGVIEPIVRDERTGLIVSGHGRTAALRGMEERGETPPEGVRTDEDGVWIVPVVTGWASKNDADARAALVALNRTSEVGGWDDTALLSLLDDLALLGDDGLAGIGYDTADLDDLTAKLQEIEYTPTSEEITGTRESTSLTDYRERYEEQGRRLIVLDYDAEEYPLVTARLRALRAETDTETNADAIAAFLARDYPETSADA